MEPWVQLLQSLQAHLVYCLQKSCIGQLCTHYFAPTCNMCQATKLDVWNVAVMPYFVWWECFFANRKVSFAACATPLLSIMQCTVWQYQIVIEHILYHCISVLLFVIGLSKEMNSFEVCPSFSTFSIMESQSVVSLFVNSQSGGWYVHVGIYVGRCTYNTWTVLPEPSIKLQKEVVAQLLYYPIGRIVSKIIGYKVKVLTLKNKLHVYIVLYN